MIIRFACVKVVDDFDSQFHWSDGNESLIRVNPPEWRNDIYNDLEEKTVVIYQILDYLN